MIRERTIPEAPVDRRFVVSTRLVPPPSRPEHIERQRLFDRLDDATTRPLTLLSAPTGFGKSTLLSAWARRSTRRAAWLTVTTGDADTVRLMAGILEAVRRSGVAIDPEVDRDLGAPGVDPADHVLPRFLDALTGGEQLVLVLDDYQRLSGGYAHELIDALVAGMPDQLHVVIATRADPVLPLGRLRAMGAMLEIRSDQLRFDVDEADRFLNGSLALGLDPRSLETLETRTEGWPAGLYLAALGLRDHPDRARFVSEFAGSSRHIVDYLTVEVLSSLPPDDRTFLLRTCILGRLSGPLCDAVTGMSGSSSRLLDLARANLFIVALDETGTWFRFHRLFAELLRSELANDAPGLEAELHQRAATWHAEHGSVETAVEHALAAGDRGWAGALVARSWREYARIGQVQTLERLLASIGDDRGALAGPLAIVEAMAAGLLGRDPALVGRLVEAGEASGWEGPTPDGRTIDSLAAVIKATFVAHDLDGQEAAARHLISRYGESDELLDTGRSLLGMILVLAGEPAGALKVLEPIDLLPEFPNVELYASAARSLATGDLGNPVAAERLARASLDRAQGWGLGASTVGGSIQLALGAAQALQGKSRDALPSLERALASWGVPGSLHRALILITLAPVYSAVGEPARARAAAREAREILDASPSAGALPDRLAVVEARLRLGIERSIPADDRPSAAEMRVLRLLASPLSAREIAAELYISINTVKTHTKALRQKLGTSSREATVAKAREIGLL
jgi:LuxR family maltose regulon positive regulatory protein